MLCASIVVCGQELERIQSQIKSGGSVSGSDNNGLTGSGGSGGGGGAEPCPNHPTALLDYFCRTCEDTLCAECVMFGTKVRVDGQTCLIHKSFHDS